MNRSKEIDPHHLGDTAGVVTVGLVHLGFQKGFGMASLDAYDRQPGLGQSLKQPLRQGSRLKPNTLEVPGGVLQELQQILGMRDDLDLTADRAGLVNDAHRSLFDRDIQTRIVFHAAFLPLRPEAAPNEPRCTISLQCSTSPGIEGSGGRPKTPSEQSRGEFASAVPSTRAGEARLSITQVPAAVRQCLLCRPQSFRSTPLQPL